MGAASPGGGDYGEALEAAQAALTEIDQQWNRHSHILRRRVLQEQGKLEIVQEKFGKAMAKLRPLLSTRDARQLEKLARQASAAISEIIIHVETEYQDESSARRGWTEVHLGLKEQLGHLGVFLHDLSEAGKRSSGLEGSPRERLTVRLRDADGAA
ncbi:hypothetical protein [Nonomuraea sp. NPDC003201]